MKKVKIRLIYADNMKYNKEFKRIIRKMTDIINRKKEERNKIEQKHIIEQNLLKTWFKK